jgi:hypothetical protein
VDSYQGWNQLSFGAFGGISRANSQIKRTILRAVKRPCQLAQLEELQPTSLLIVSADEKEVGL